MSHWHREATSPWVISLIYMLIIGEQELYIESFAHLPHCARDLNLGLLSYEPSVLTTTLYHCVCMCVMSEWMKGQQSCLHPQVKDFFHVVYSDKQDLCSAITRSCIFLLFACVYVQVTRNGITSFYMRWTGSMKSVTSWEPHHKCMR